MSLEIYTDDALTSPLRQMERFSTVGQNTFPLVSLVGIDVGEVYKYSGGYTKLATPADYTVIGNSVILVANLGAGEHIVVMPIDNMDIVFTGPEGAVRTQTKKVVFHKTGAFIYDALKIYSEDFTVAPYEYTETVVTDGFMAVSLTGLGLFDKNGIGIDDSNAVGMALFSTNLALDLTYTWPSIAVVINGAYVGQSIANDASTIAFPLGTTIPTPNYVSDVIEVFSTAALTFALDSNGTIPADDAFKPVLVIPTLTTAAPTQKVWLRESASIPAVTAELPNLPFKLTGQEYPE